MESDRARQRGMERKRREEDEREKKHHMVYFAIACTLKAFFIVSISLC